MILMLYQIPDTLCSFVIAEVSDLFSQFLCLVSLISIFHECQPSSNSQCCTKTYQVWYQDVMQLFLVALKSCSAYMRPLSHDMGAFTTFGFLPVKIPSALKISFFRFLFSKSGIISQCQTVFNF